MTTCIRCSADLESEEDLTTGICPECWTPEDENDAPELHPRLQQHVEQTARRARREAENIKQPTLRKLRNRGLTPIRYQMPNAGGFYNGWIVEERTRGALTIRLVCEDRNRRLSAEDARYVTVIH